MNWYAILTMATTLSSIVGVVKSDITGRVTVAEARTGVPIYSYVLRGSSCLLPHCVRTKRRDPRRS
jgi:hypothetical protein